MNEKIALTAEKYLGKSKSELRMTAVEWCANFVSRVLFENDLGDYQSNSCNTMFNLMKNSDCWILPETAPQRGDVIFFDWDGALDSECKNRPLDHVGIVANCDGKTLSYIDGNSDTSGIVKKHSIILDWCSFNNKYPWYYMRYINPTPKTTANEVDIMELLDIIEKNIKIIRNAIDKT